MRIFAIISAIFFISGFSFFEQKSEKNQYEFPNLMDFTNKTPGAAVLIVKNGETILKKGYGLADIENKIEISPDTIFESGSVGKMFTAAAILQLERDGKLSIEDPVKKYIPNAKIPNKILIKNLIFHTSSLPDYLNDDSLNLDEKVNSGIKIDNNFVLDYISKKPLNGNKIGSKFEYSNTNYVLLSMIIEATSGKSYEKYMNEDVFEAAGMGAFIHTPDRQNSTMESRSYSEWPHFKLLKNKTNYITTGDFGVQFSINDFEKMIKSQKFTETLQTILTKKGTTQKGRKIEEINYGYGMRFGKIGDFDCAFHRGYINGASNIFVYNKNLDAYVVILSNTSSLFTENLAKYILNSIASQTKTDKIPEM